MSCLILAPLRHIRRLLLLDTKKKSYINTNRKSAVKDPNVSLDFTLSDLQRLISISYLFLKPVAKERG